MTTRPTSNVTGRDGYIVASALAYASAAIVHLPEWRQPQSDREDMLDLLGTKFPGIAQLLLDEAAEKFSHLNETEAEFYGDGR